MLSHTAQAVFWHVLLIWGATFGFNAILFHSQRMPPANRTALQVFLDAHAHRLTPLSLALACGITGAMLSTSYPGWTGTEASLVFDAAGAAFLIPLLVRSLLSGRPQKGPTR